MWEFMLVCCLYRDVASWTPQVLGIIFHPKTSLLSLHLTGFTMAVAVLADTCQKAKNCF